MSVNQRAIVSRLGGFSLGTIGLFAAFAISGWSVSLGVSQTQPPAKTSSKPKPQAVPSNRPVVTNPTESDIIEDKLAQLQDELEESEAKTALENAKTQVEIRKAELAQAQFEFDNAKTYADQAKKILSRRAIDSNQLQNATRSLAVAEANLSIKKLQIQQAIVQARQAEIRMRTIPAMIKLLRARLQTPLSEADLLAAPREALIERIRMLESQNAELKQSLIQKRSTPGASTPNSKP